MEFRLFSGGILEGAFDMKQARHPKPQTVVYLAVSLFLAFVVLAFAAVSFAIGRQVRSLCLAAVTRYGGDCVAALSHTVEDESNSFRDRNSAIWALGQLGDRRALPTIGKYYTGEIPPHEPYDAGLSQFELFKALTLIETGHNITAFLWR